MTASDSTGLVTPTPHPPPSSTDQQLSSSTARESLPDHTGNDLSASSPPSIPSTTSSQQANDNTDTPVDSTTTTPNPATESTSIPFNPSSPLSSLTSPSSHSPPSFFTLPPSSSPPLTNTYSPLSSTHDNTTDLTGESDDEDMNDDTPRPLSPSTNKKSSSSSTKKKNKNSTTPTTTTKSTKVSRSVDRLSKQSRLTFSHTTPTTGTNPLPSTSPPTSPTSPPTPSATDDSDREKKREKKTENNKKKKRSPSSSSPPPSSSSSSLTPSPTPPPPLSHPSITPTPPTSTTTPPTNEPVRATIATNPATLASPLPITAASVAVPPVPALPVSNPQPVTPPTQPPSNSPLPPSPPSNQAAQPPSVKKPVSHPILPKDRQAPAPSNDVRQLGLPIFSPTDLVITIQFPAKCRRNTASRLPRPTVDRTAICAVSHLLTHSLTIPPPTLPFLCSSLPFNSDPSQLVQAIEQRWSTDPTLPPAATHYLHDLQSALTTGDVAAFYTTLLHAPQDLRTSHSHLFQSSWMCFLNERTGVMSSKKVEFAQHHTIHLGLNTPLVKAAIRHHLNTYASRFQQHPSLPASTETHLSPTSAPSTYTFKSGSVVRGGMTVSPPPSPSPTTASSTSPPRPTAGHGVLSSTTLSTTTIN